MKSNVLKLSATNVSQQEMKVFHVQMKFEKTILVDHRLKKSRCKIIKKKSKFSRVSIRN